MYHYQFAGLSLISELELPAMSEGRHGPTVKITLGIVPGSIPHARRFGRDQASDEACLLDVAGVARFYVVRGSQIVVEPQAGAPWASLRAFLTGPALGVLLHQRGLLPLHASAVEIRGRVVGFMGKPGSGKSTILAFLQDRGHLALCDDICPVQVTPEGTAVAYSGVAAVKLRVDVLTALGLDASVPEPEGAGLTKYRVRTHRTPPHCARSLAGLYELVECGNAASFRIAPASGAEKMALLLANTYRLRCVGAMRRKREHFKACRGVLESVPMYKLSLGRDLSRMGDAVDCLERHLEKSLP